MKKTVIIIVLLVLGLCSFFVLEGFASNPETYVGTIEVLEEKQNTVMTLTAASAAASTALSAIPGDAGTPVATQISEISVYLFAVLCIIFLEKYMLTVIGFIVCKFALPVACALGITYVLMDDKKVLRDLAIKIAVVSLLSISIVPLSVGITQLIEETNNIQISEIEVEVETEETTKTESSGILSWFENLTENTSEFVESVTNVPEKAKEIMVDVIDNVAIVLITSCVIPILVMVCYFFLFKSIFKFDLHPPHPGHLKLPHSKEL